MPGAVRVIRRITQLLDWGSPADGSLLQWSGSQVVAATNVPLLNAANTFTAAQLISAATGTYKFQVASSTDAGGGNDYVARFGGSSSFMGILLDATKVGGTGQPNMFFAKNGANKFQFGCDYNANGTNDFFIYSQAGSALRFYIASDGKIGLGGTTAPASMLDLWGGVFTISDNSSTTKRSQGDWVGAWVTSTDASRKARITGRVYDTLARTWLIAEASGTAPMVGFLGAAAAARQTGGVATASGTYGATEQGMIQKAYDALRTFGFLT
jgi:hypothetical protein